MSIHNISAAGFKIRAKQALLATGWANDVTLSVGADGRILSIDQKDQPADHQVAVLLPALSNLHCHSFQRAMAGLAEQSASGTSDDFWSWRKVMYRFLELLTPEDIQSVATLVQMEMLEAGYAAQAEFHYLHHDQDGQHYENVAETSLRHLEAAAQTGIGYTHLPVLYMQGGLDGRSLSGGQLRFGSDLDQFENICAEISHIITDFPSDFKLGVAPHSLRAVTQGALKSVSSILPAGPVHIHAAEQMREVRDVEAVYGARPVEWLLGNMDVDERWCFIHATHMTDKEVGDLAASKAVAGLCPLTEANLGDGVFPGERFACNGGRFGVGSDSNIRIALSEELRQLETSIRLADQKRIVMTGRQHHSNGRYLYEAAARGGAQALGRNSGSMEVGQWADLVALDDQHINLVGLEGDLLLDSWIFGSDDSVVSDVWAAGRHAVKEGRHIGRDSILASYRSTIAKLRAAL